jgi:transposase-like protein
MGRIRRSFDIQFKMKVCGAIDAGQRTVLEICREFQLQRPVVEGWLKKYVRGDLAPRSKTKESANILTCRYCPAHTPAKATQE